MLTYIRVYSGKLKPAERILNSNLKENEKPMKLYRVLADDMEVMNEVSLLNSTLTTRWLLVISLPLLG